MMACIFALFDYEVYYLIHLHARMTIRSCASLPGGKKIDSLLPASCLGFAQSWKRGGVRGVGGEGVIASPDLKVCMCE